MDIEDFKLVTIKENENYLRQVSAPVKMYDTNLDKYIDVLENYCKNNTVLAMAAVQLSIPKRIIYLKNTNLAMINYNSVKDYNEARVLINPVIVKKTGLTKYWEACRSCLNNVGLVSRPYQILVRYFDRNWNEKLDIFEGFETTVLSHEMDHLDGILHIDIAEKILNMPTNERRKFTKTHGYEIISKYGSYDALLKNTTP